MTKQKRKHSITHAAQAGNSTFVLKLCLYVILGLGWLKLSHGASLQLPVPIGFLFGLVLASHEHFMIDRKIEYAVLVVAVLIGYLAPFGLYVAL